ncbi:MAG: hypothetical protein Q8M15_06735 [Bacteroidota bacterium]|nr:hypothetical protein [Bacteroidota bacterium]
MKKSTLVITLLALFAISSCSKKDDSSTTPTKTKAEYLTSGTWNIKAASINPGLDMGGITITDLYAVMQSCDKDNTRKFNTNGTGKDDEGATKCNASEPQTTDFTWVFDSSQTKLTENGTDVYNVLQLDASTCKVSMVVDGADCGGTPGVKYTFTFTSGH